MTWFLPQGPVTSSVPASAFPLLAPDGSASAPSYSFASSGNSDNGLFLVGNNAPAIAASGSAVVSFNFGTGNGVRLYRDVPLSWSSAADVTSTADVLLYRDAANVLALRNGTSAQTFRVYNTWTDASNYESLEFLWSSNVAIIRTNAATGTIRQLRFSYGGGTGSAIIVPATSGTVDVAFAVGNGASVSSTGRFGVGRTATVAATSGTHYEILANASFIPTSTSTMVAIGLSLEHTINYSAGTPGAGRVQLLRLSPTNTALPTGPSAAIVLSSTASALGGIQLHNQTDETTDSESATLSYSSNVLTLSSTAAGSGTVRNINLSVANAAGSAVVLHSATSTITGGVTDGYTAGLRLTPTYNAATAQTVTRHNYIDLNDAVLGGAGPAALTAAAVFRLDAALGTHKATTNTDKTGNAKSGTLIVNVAGTLYHIQLYAT